MTARDLVGGVASTVLMFSKIGLCLVFAFQDFLTEHLSASGTPIDRQTRLSALRR